MRPWFSSLPSMSLPSCAIVPAMCVATAIMPPPDVRFHRFIIFFSDSCICCSYMIARLACFIPRFLYFFTFQSVPKFNEHFILTFFICHIRFFGVLNGDPLSINICFSMLVISAVVVFAIFSLCCCWCCCCSVCVSTCCWCGCCCVCVSTSVASLSTHWFGSNLSDAEFLLDIQPFSGKFGLRACSQEYHQEAMDVCAQPS